MTSTVFIRDKTIAFSKNIMRPNELYYKINVEELYTNHGFIIPLDSSSIDILDYLQYGEDELCLHERVCRCMLIDCHERVYDVLMIQPEASQGIHTVQLSKTRILVGKGTLFARSMIAEDERNAIMSLELTNTVKQATVLHDSTFGLFTTDYVVMDIAKIAKALTDSAKVLPFPRLGSRKIV
jgi:hypothetical protein